MPHLSRRIRLCILGAIGVVVLTAFWPANFAGGANPTGGPAAECVLHLTNDGFVTGDLRDSDGKGGLRWQSPAFARAFDFALSGVNAVHFPVPAKLPVASGEYCFELERGDVVFGSIVSWNGDDLVLDLSKIGRVHVGRSELLRFFRWRESAGIVYQGPQGLAGWQVAATGSPWREEFGQLLAEKEGVIRRNLGIPARSMIEIELSWKKKPDFSLALGVGEDEQSPRPAFSFEVWGTDLAVVRELDEVADPSLVMPIAPGAGRAHLHVYLDQEQGRCLVFSATGKRLAESQVSSKRSAAAGGIRLENKRGDIRLERLRIAQWGGELPREVRADQPRVQRPDGAITYGQVTGYDAAARKFTIQGEDGAKSQIAADALDSAVLAFPSESEPPPVRASYHDGVQVTGEFLKVAAGAVWLKSPAIREPLGLPLAGLRSLLVLKPESITAPDDVGPIANLELEGAKLRGYLADADTTADGTCLAWHPLGSSTASPLRPNASGRIVYRDRSALPAGRPSSVTRVLGGGALNILPGPAEAIDAAARKGMANANPPRAAGQPSLYLRSGDTIPCTVTGIDEKGLSFKSPLSDATYVTHDKIKAVELVRETQNAPGLTRTKRERLLTLPRMQKDSPPTHLIRSRNGDYLRGRVIGLDDERVQVEVRLETKEVPRDRVSRIIWLHAEELGGTAAEPKAEGEPVAGKENDSGEPSIAEQKIARALDKPTTVDFKDKPLEDCLTFLHEYHDVNIVVDKKTLSEEGVAIEDPQTLKVKEISFRSVLRLILEPLDLKYFIENNAIQITTSTKFAERESQRSSEISKPAADGTRLRVQVVRSDGVRLTFTPEKFAEAALSGTSDVLGACRVPMNQIDQLLIGGAIEQAASQLAYQQWVLHHAIEPKFANGGESGDGGDAGTESVLVGKPAPLFELELLSGGKFRLAEQKGHVVVLDFWATWCGPCLAAMPQVDRATRDFADQGVQLIAVNLEETPKQIKSMLERHKLDLTVALDRDGAVAEKYKASAIPQTVVIDKEGNVVRVFIGGGPNFDDQVRDALRPLFPDAKPVQ